MSDCIFCKLANGEIPTSTLYVDDDFRVILDAGPASKGHALILPRKHYENLMEMPEDLLSRAAVLAKKMAVRLKDGLGCDGLNVVQNNGTVAGQSVFHFHIHLIPRYADDRQNILWKPGELTPEAAQEILSLFEAAE
jgi:histidine triad (HIT) family protein